MSTVTISASILIVTFNSARHIRTCLEALLATIGPEQEVIVVDNASVDDSIAQVQAFGERVRLVASPVNRGFAGGVNLAARHASGRILVLINPDVLVRPGWFQALTEALDAPGVGVAGGKGLYPDGRLQHAGGYVDPASGFTVHLGDGEPDEPRYNQLREADYVSGFALSTLRAVWQELGGLSEVYFPAYFEEIDYCYRARRIGWKTVYQPRAEFEHDHKPPPDPDRSLSLSINRQRWLFVMRHFAPEAIRSLIATERRIMQAAQNNRGHTLPLARGFADLISMWPQACIARADDSSLGGPVPQPMQVAIEQDLLSLFRRILAEIARDQALPKIQAVRDQLGSLPQPPESLEITGNRFRDHLARWLIKPYLDTPMYNWRRYADHLSGTLQVITESLSGLALTGAIYEDLTAGAPTTGPSSPTGSDLDTPRSSETNV